MHLQIDNVVPIMGEAPFSLYISEGKFVAGPPSAAHMRLDLPSVLALPGLINSHDHLEFNCFPALGDHHHSDYVTWGKDIHARYKPQIDAVLRIPAELRARWGVYKNLLGGVTTVVQHGRSLDLARAPIRVVEEPQSIHSVGLEAYWKRRLNNPRRFRQPSVIHIGEGVNELASAEVKKLLRWNLLHRPLIGVHGIAMTPAQASRFHALVWCPVSNYFLYGKTADVNNLGKNTSLLFGTDSTLTGHWDIWEHISMAIQTGMMDESNLLNALTTSAAEVWNLPTARLAPGYDADLVLMRASASPVGVGGLRQLTSEDILLVLSRGNPVLVDESLYPGMEREGFSFDGWSAIKLAGRGKENSIKYLTGDLPALMAQIHQFDPSVQFPVEPVAAGPTATAGPSPVTPAPQTTP